jgi:hypothetical protein
MDSNAINLKLNKIIHDKFSPTDAEKAYISSKYNLISSALGGRSFQTGSYARFTAVHPVHDLDIIYVTDDVAVESDPAKMIRDLEEKIKTVGLPGVTKINRQSHSVEILFDDWQKGVFSVDVVPAIELQEEKDGEKLFKVPEILMTNRAKRAEMYLHSQDRPIGWVKTDPKGYINQATNINNQNANFRHCVKLLKSWKHVACKGYGDQLKLKSFHIEQAVARQFALNIGSATVDAALDSVDFIINTLGRPSIPDRADTSRFIDGYMEDIDQEQKLVLGKELRTASDNLLAISKSASDDELRDCLNILLSMRNMDNSFPSSSATVTPNKPWCNCNGMVKK